MAKGSSGKGGKGASPKKAKDASAGAGAKGDGQVESRCTLCNKKQQSVSMLNQHFIKCQKEAKEAADKINRVREETRAREAELAANQTRSERRS